MQVHLLVTAVIWSDATWYTCYLPRLLSSQTPCLSALLKSSCCSLCAVKRSVEGFLGPSSHPSQPHADFISRHQSNPSIASQLQLFINAARIKMFNSLRKPPYLTLYLTSIVLPVAQTTCKLYYEKTSNVLADLTSMYVWGIHHLNHRGGQRTKLHY